MYELFQLKQVDWGGGWGGGGILPAGTLNINNLLNIKPNAAKLGEFF